MSEYKSGIALHCLLITDEDVHIAKHEICTDECRKLSRSARKAGLAIDVAFSTWRAIADVLFDVFDWQTYNINNEWIECLKLEVAQTNAGWSDLLYAQIYLLNNNRIGVQEQISSYVVFIFCCTAIHSMAWKLLIKELLHNVVFLECSSNRKFIFQSYIMDLFDLSLNFDN